MLNEFVWGLFNGLWTWDMSSCCCSWRRCFYVFNRRKISALSFIRRMWRYAPYDKMSKHLFNRLKNFICISSFWMAFNRLITSLMDLTTRVYSIQTCVTSLLVTSLYCIVMHPNWHFFGRKKRSAIEKVHFRWALSMNEYARRDTTPSPPLPPTTATTTYHFVYSFDIQLVSRTFSSSN